MKIFQALDRPRNKLSPRKRNLSPELSEVTVQNKVGLYEPIAIDFFPHSSVVRFAGQLESLLQI